MVLSIIVLSYNTKLLTISCIGSVIRRYETELRKKVFEIIVVDNASEDESVEEIQKKFSQVKIIENKENLGFATGCNIGASHANGTFLLFLNSDTELFNNGLKEMIEKMDKDTSIGVIGGKLMNPDHTTSDSHGSFYNLLTVIQMIFGMRRSSMKNEREQVVDWVSGGFMLIRKDLFEKLNGFDERFFMYVEDVDFCFRVKQMEYRVLYFPKTEALHKGQGSSTRSFAIAYIYQGILLYFKKHKSLFEYFIIKGLLTLKGIIAIILGTITGNMYLVTTYKKALRF